MRFCVILLLLLTHPEPIGAQSGGPWRALASGQAVGLMRHALAPGTKDPANADLRNCATQRNLSAGGRAQARRIGRHFRRMGVKSAAVYTSAWCRCRHTARLLGFGGATVSAALNALAKGPRGRSQTARLAAMVRNAGAGRATILVTHKTNIAALTGVTPASGETVVVSRSGRVLGRIRTR